MRLSHEQISHIRSTIAARAAGKTFSLYLYGSRTQSDLGGGDIDLLIITSYKNDLLNLKYEIINDLKKSSVVGERKIDLMIATEEEKNSDPFLRIIMPSAVLIGSNTL